MKNSKGIGFGVFLLTIGIVWTLVSLKVISLSVFYSIITLWPLVLVMIGINIIFRNKPLVNAITWIALLAVIIVYGHYNYDSRFDSDSALKASNVAVEKTGSQKAVLDLSLGGMKFNVDSDTDKLLEASLNDPYARYDVKTAGSTTTIKFGRDEFKPFVFAYDGYRGDFHLDPAVAWDLNIKMGAVNGTLDLTGIAAENIKMSTGAADLTLIMGDKASNSNVDIKAGASKFELHVPKTAGVTMVIKNALSSTNVDELGWTKNGNIYTSPNYDGAAVKINVSCSMGAGKIDVYTD